MTPDQAAALRAPFPAESIGKLPKAGIKLDYVGHAAVTDRLLQVDPDWSWEPIAWSEFGTPQIIYGDQDAVLWIRLTVAGVSRPGVGIVNRDTFELEKQLISDALRNAAMRFGVALDLWSKEDLGSHPVGNSTQGADPLPPLTPDNSGAAPSSVSKHRVGMLQSRASALVADGVRITEYRQRERLPIITACGPEELDHWDALLTRLEEDTAPFVPPKNEDGSDAPTLLPVDNKTLGNIENTAAL